MTTAHRTHRLTRHLTLVLAVAGLALTACGSDDDAASGTSAATPASSRAASLTTVTADSGSDIDFVSAANAVCTDAGVAIGQIVGGIMGKGDAATDDERATAATQLLAAVNTEIDGLAAITPPADAAADYAAMLDSARAAAKVVEQQGAGFWLTSDDPFADTNAKAAALGLDVCAGAPS